MKCACLHVYNFTNFSASRKGFFLLVIYYGSRSWMGFPELDREALGIAIWSGRFFRDCNLDREFSRESDLDREGFGFLLTIWGVSAHG